MRGAHPTFAILDEARVCFEVLTEDGVPPRKAYEYANKILPAGFDLRDFEESEEA
ncbi:hypothetical protein [Streptomyces paradoxus]|uniref:hypothetical protein n=1 Tax=Streptomyces paradoxus TaxID=66375 RepID=UPI0037D5BBB6